MDTPLTAGREWLIEATGCSASSLRDPETLKSVFESIIRDLGLKTIGSPIWHKFPGEGGVTGLVALTESHLACHTYPEHNLATFNLYCCKDRPEWDWKRELADRISAEDVRVTMISRGVELGTKNNSGENEFEFEMTVAGGDA